MSPTSYRAAPSRVTTLLAPFYWCRGSESNRYGVLPPQDFKSCASASSATPAFFMALRVGLEPTTYRLTAGCSTIELPKNTCCLLGSLLIFQTGDFLLSRAVASQVPSTVESLTSVFGMGTGVSSLLLSPDSTANYFHIFFSLVKSSTY